MLRAWTGEAAIEHLFLVACGLDSAQAGEREIAAQLREAWEAARLAGTCAATLDHVIGEALSMSNRMQRLAAGARAPSLADLAAGSHAPAHAAAGDQPVALVGVSPMTRRAGEGLHARACRCSSSIARPTRPSSWRISRLASLSHGLRSRRCRSRISGRIRRPWPAS